MKENLVPVQTPMGDASATALLEAVWQEADAIMAMERTEAAKRRTATGPPPSTKENREEAPAGRVRFAYD